jgi:hypothetical protein
MNKISTRLEVDVFYSPIINFAIQQNHVPVIRKLTIKNIGQSELSNIQIHIIPKPEFAVKWNKKIDALPKEEMVDMGAIEPTALETYPRHFQAERIRTINLFYYQRTFLSIRRIIKIPRYSKRINNRNSYFFKCRVRTPIKEILLFD